MQTMHELSDLPEIEYLDGRPHRKVSPKLSHSFVQGRIMTIITRCAGSRGPVLPELRVRPGAIDAKKTEFVPDVCFISHDRLRALSTEDREETPYSPDIAVEVRSPKDNLKYLAEKIARYLNTGSALVLDVDPKSRTIHAFSATGAREYAPGQTSSDDTFGWLRFDVAEVFEPLDTYWALHQILWLVDVGKRAGIAGFVLHAVQPRIVAYKM